MFFKYNGYTINIKIDVTNFCDFEMFKNHVKSRVKCEPVEMHMLVGAVGPTNTDFKLFVGDTSLETVTRSIVRLSDALDYVMPRINDDPAVRKGKIADFVWEFISENFGV